MMIDKVSREDLRAIRVGETRSFTLPTYAACLAARSNAYILGRLDGCRFSVVIAQETNTVSITRYDH